MSINSIINAEKYSEELDKVFTQKSVTGFFADNALAAKFVGAKTVLIPDIDFQGLADYDRNNGFNKGAITIGNTSYTMTMDRARSLQIDREDMDESGVANLAGKVLGEYVRTKVVPECDAYVLSKLAKIAKTNGNAIIGAPESPISTLFDMINKIQSKAGFDTELVAFVNGPMYAYMQGSDELSKMITVSDFKQGELSLQVKSINGVPIIPVSSERMKSAFSFKNDSTGGFTPTDEATDVYMIVCPKNAVHLVKKTENMRIFTPEQNVDADAYKFDYRIYYDAFISKHNLDLIYACMADYITVVYGPNDADITLGAPSTLDVHANINDPYIYRWYRCDDANGSNPKLVAEGDSFSYEVSNEEYAPGTYYFMARVYSDSINYAQSRVATVNI